jgi:hypothetical protein
MFVWGKRARYGVAEGKVWRDNTEQDFSGIPAGYVRETLMGGEFADNIMVRGAEFGEEMGVGNLDAAAGYLWGFHAATRAANHQNSAMLQNVAWLTVWDVSQTSEHFDDFHERVTKQGTFSLRWSAEASEGNQATHDAFRVLSAPELRDEMGDVVGIQSFENFRQWATQRLTEAPEPCELGLVDFERLRDRLALEI